MEQKRRKNQTADVIVMGGIVIEDKVMVARGVTI